MTKLLLFTLAALVATPSPLASKAAETGSPAFPAKFRGDWYGVPGPCNPENLALQVGDSSLNYFDEFSGRMVRIIRQTDSAVEYAAEYSAEGRMWEATETLRLSSNGNEMTLTPERTASRYYRCTPNGAK